MAAIRVSYNQYVSNFQFEVALSIVSSSYIKETKKFQWMAHIYRPRYKYLKKSSNIFSGNSHQNSEIENFLNFSAISIFSGFLAQLLLFVKKIR